MTYICKSKTKLSFQKVKSIFFIFLVVSNISYSQSNMLDENDFNTKFYDVLFTNQSILGCGSSNNLDVYSSFDIQVLLSISNAISSNKVALETNWDKFQPPSLTSVNFSEDQYNILPNDIKRILFLCLTWNESERLKLFAVPDAALDNITKRMQDERPWHNLDPKVVKKIDSLSKESLKQFIHIVLRANVFESARGDFLNNKSLWFISWNWFTANPGLYE